MRNGLPALGEGEPSRQIRMFIHLYAKRKVCNQIFTGYKLIIRVAKEMKRTARFLRKIGDTLTKIDCTAAKDNAK